MPRNAHFWQIGLLGIVLSEYPDKSHNFRNFIFMTSHFSTLCVLAGFLKKEIEKADIHVSDTGENPEAPHPREMIDLEVS